MWKDRHVVVTLSFFLIYHLFSLYVCCGFVKIVDRVSKSEVEWFSCNVISPSYLVVGLCGTYVDILLAGIR